VDRERVEDIAEAWLRENDPEGPRWNANAFDREVPVGSDPTATRYATNRNLVLRRRGPRPLHVPAGHASVAGGWLIPDCNSLGDVAVAAAVYLRAGGKTWGTGPGAEVRTKLERVAARASSLWLSQRIESLEPAHMWRPTLAFRLRVEACTPARYRRTADKVIALMARAWVGLGPDAPPLPRLLPALRLVAGDHLQRLTPAPRGGGRGRGARVSCDRAVARLARLVASDERDSLAIGRVLHLLQEHPGLSLRQLSTSGGDPRMLRRAVALLQGQGRLREWDTSLVDDSSHVP
jgi:hypothetical protein